MCKCLAWGPEPQTENVGLDFSVKRTPHSIKTKMEMSITHVHFIKRKSPWIHELFNCSYYDLPLCVLKQPTSWMINLQTKTKIAPKNFSPFGKLWNKLWLTCLKIKKCTCGFTFNNSYKSSCIRLIFDQWIFSLEDIPLMTQRRSKTYPQHAFGNEQQNQRRSACLTSIHNHGHRKTEFKGNNVPIDCVQ